jgi:hypothetical protein
MEEQKPFPITPSPELVEQWAHLPADWNTALIAQWGADQELAACCEYLLRCAQWEPEDVDELLAARRPKPPSLKEQALEALKHAPGPDYPNPITLLTADEHALIRRALEQLDD